MRLNMRGWGAMVLLPATLMLAGCGGGSIMPGIGTSGGLGTIGGGIQNPDATLVSRVKGSRYGDFIAQGNDVRLTRPPSINQIEGKQDYRLTNTKALRTMTITFLSTPVAGRSYSVDSEVEIKYTETTFKSNGTTDKFYQWLGSSGHVKVTRVNAERVDAEFSGELKSDLGNQNNLTLSSGLLHLKF